MDRELLAEYQKRIRELEEEVAYYQREYGKLESQNEVLHETAWNLICQLREIKDKKETKNTKKD